MNADRPTPAVLPRRQFTDAEEQDITNREARASFWARRMAEEDEARAAELLPTLPVERRSQITRDFLSGKKTHDELVADVLGKGEE